MTVYVRPIRSREKEVREKIVGKELCWRPGKAGVSEEQEFKEGEGILLDKPSLIISWSVWKAHECCN
jgi:hypothetical protein